VVPRGQEIQLPPGLKRLYVLAASASGDQDVTFNVGNQPEKVTIQHWSGFIGQWDDRQWKQTEVVVQPRTPPPDVPPDIAAQLQRPRTRLNPYGEMTGITPGFTKHARALTLPNNDNVRILAITGSNEGTPVRSPDPLYDRLER